MIKSKNFNNISDELVPKLGRNEVAIFRCIHNSKDPSGIGIYPTYIVPNKDTIWDEDQGKYVDIAYITQPSDDRAEVLGTIAFESNQKGVIVLKGSSSADVLRYEYLKLCNYNASNPKRNPDSFTIFEEVNESDRSISLLGAAKIQAEIANFALNTDLETLVQELKNRNIDAKGLPEHKVRSIALEEGKKQPFKLVSLPEKVDIANTKALVMEAIEAGLITYDSKDGVFKGNDGEVFFKAYKATTNKEDKFAEYLDKNPEVKEKIKKLF